MLEVLAIKDLKKLDQSRSKMYDETSLLVLNEHPLTGNLSQDR